MEGKLHVYHPHRGLTLFELTPQARNWTHSYPPENILLFIGGMWHNFGTPSYVSSLASLFPRHQDQKWAVMHIQLSSAMRGFGVSDIDKDIDEISEAIAFIRTSIRPAHLHTNIVLMGFSTGCQDIVYYLCSQNPLSDSRPPRQQVQGAILQAPVSDREALQNTVAASAKAKASYENCLDMISQTPETLYRTTLLPMHWTIPLLGPVPMSISRFLSLASPNSPDNPSKEDLLSSDLSPETTLNRTFGNIGPNNLLNPAKGSTKTMLVLISDEDRYYSPAISKIKQRFLDKWSAALSSPPPSPSTRERDRVQLHRESKCIPNASHDVSENQPGGLKAQRVDLRKAVLLYIDDVVGGVDEIAWEIFRREEKEIMEDSEGKQQSRI